MADPNPHSPEIRPEQRVDRPQPVMAGSAAAAFHPKFARPQIDLVVDHDDFRRRNLEETCCLGDRLAGIVHKGLRLQQQPALAADDTFRNLALESVAKARDALTAGDQVDRQEADIVAVTRVTRARIAEADDETHRSGYRKASAGNSASSRLLGRGRRRRRSGSSFLAHGRGGRDAGDREIAVGDRQP